MVLLQCLMFINSVERCVSVSTLFRPQLVVVPSQLRHTTGFMPVRNQ